MAVTPWKVELALVIRDSNHGPRVIAINSKVSLDFTESRTTIWLNDR
jgi:hypothetical protein